MIEAALVAVVLWLMLGSYLVYYGQNWMKKWYELEANAHHVSGYGKLSSEYQKIYDKE